MSSIMKAHYQSLNHLFRLLPALLAFQALGAGIEPVLAPLTDAASWPAFPLGPVFDVQVAGNYAYLTQGRRGLAVFDVRQPANIKQVGSFDIGGFVLGVQVAGSRAYVTESGWGLHVL